MKNKIISLALVIILTVQSVTVVFAHELEMPITKTNPNQQIVNIEATVVNVMQLESFKRLVVKKSTNEVVAFNFFPNAPIYNYSSIQANPSAGDKILIAYDTKSPVLDGFPPQINAIAGVVLKPDSDYKVSINYFDQKGLSSNKANQIISAEASDIFDIFGHKITDTKILQNRNLIVMYFYSKGLKPIQLIPKVIIALDTVDITPRAGKQITDYYSSLSEEQIYNTDTAKYVRLTDLAQKLNLKVAWLSDTQEVTLTNGTSFYKLKVDEKQHTINDNIGYFGNPPTIVDGKTFIELDFALRLLLENTKIL